MALTAALLASDCCIRNEAAPAVGSMPIPMPICMPPFMPSPCACTFIIAGLPSIPMPPRLPVIDWLSAFIIILPVIMFMYIVPANFATPRPVFMSKPPSFPLAVVV